MRRRLVNQQLEPRRLNPLAKILLALFALLLTPNLAWAQTSYGITVKHNGTNYRVTSANASDVLGDGKVTYNVTNSVLTLDNAIINGCIYFNSYDPTDPDGTLNGTFTIWIKGTCIITASDSCAIKNTTPLSLDSNSGKPAYPNSQNTARGTVNLIPLNEGGNRGNLTMIPKGNPSVGLFQYVSNSDERLGDQDGILVIYSQLFSGGVGTDTDPYIIGSAYDLKTFTICFNNNWISSDACIKIDDSVESLDCSGISDIEPIGDDNKKFSGTFDGKNKTIKNLSITGNAGAYVGIFRSLTTNGNIENLTLDNLTISGGATSSNFIGGLVGYMDGGTISGCTIKNSSISCLTTTSNPSVGGFVGYIGGSATISSSNIISCVVKAETSSMGESGACAIGGGIAGTTMGSNVNGCRVKGTTAVSANHNDEGALVYAGALVGKNDDGYFTDNAYEYTVTAKARTTTKSGYTQRGIGNGDDVSADNGAVMYTKKVTFPTVTGATITKDGNYYSYDATGINIAPGQTATMIVEPSAGNSISSFTATNVDDADISSEALSENRTRYSFEMPDAAVTVNVTCNQVYNLWVGDTQVTSANAAHILGEGNTTVSFTAADPQQANSVNTLTLNGATLTVPVKVGLASLTIDIQGTNSITTAETCIQNTLNTVGTTPAVTFKSTSTEKGSLILKNTSGDLTGVNNIGVDDKGSFTISDELALVLKKDGFIYSNQYWFTDGSTKEAILSPSYGVTIGGMQICKDNAADIIGEGIEIGDGGKVSFNKETNTLTLNKADISGAISTSLAELTVELVGDNTISAGDNPAFQSSSGNAVSISIQSTAEEKGNLTMNCNTGGNFYDNHVTLHIIDPLDVVSGSLTGSSTVIIGEYYNLDVAETKVTYLNKDNVMGDNKITFTPSSNTLTLNGATINGSILYNGTEDLTIALNGINSVTNTYGTYAIYTNGGDFNFVKADGASSAELTAICGDGYTPVGLYNSTLGSGLYWLPIAQNQTIITEDPDFVLVGGYVINHGDTKTGTSGTITYTVNGSEKTLTFTNYQNTFGDGYGEVNAIETGIEGLKVILVGENTITCKDPDTYAFKGIRDGASIQFVKGGDGCKLTMNMENTTNPLSFADGKITYEGLVYYPTDMYITAPKAPEMEANDDNKVELTVDFSGGTIKYSIDYVDDETTDVTEATYSAPFTMAAPGTVTAWAEANVSDQTSTVKGKYFGYKDAPFSMEAGDTKIPELIPAFEDGDNIGYKATDTYESSATGVATFTGGTITAEGIGTATLTAKIDYKSDNQPVIILNPDKEVIAEVNVGTIPEITFADGMEYATYCNTTGYDLTIPAGLKAYAVTGTNGDVVTLAEVDFLPKVDGTDYVALLLKREDTSAAVGLALVSAGGTRPTTNCLMYNYTAADITTTGYEYVLYKEEFLKATGTIPAGKCYLYLSGGAAPARASYGISHGEGNDTGIDNLVFDEDGTEKWYDLRGRRIEKPTKAGLYIRNGEKIVVNDNNK